MPTEAASAKRLALRQTMSYPWRTARPSEQWTLAPVALLGVAAAQYRAGLVHSLPPARPLQALHCHCRHCGHLSSCFGRRPNSASAVAAQERLKIRSSFRRFLYSFPLRRTLYFPARWAGQPDTPIHIG